MPARRLFVAALALFAALLLFSDPLAAQRVDSDDWLERCRDSGRHDARHCEVRELGFRPDGIIRVDAGHAGGVRVTAWDRDSVHVEARVQATDRRSGRTAGEIAREVRVEASSREVRAHGPRSDDGRNWSVSYVLRVPTHSELAVSARSGPASVEGVSGRIEVETRNGPLTLNDVSGDVRGRTRNGPVRVRLAGSRWDGRGLDVETTNGPVTLEIPEGYSAWLEVGTTNGPLVGNGLPVNVERRRTRRVETELGSGGATIRAFTTNGPVTIRRTLEDGR